MQSTPSMRLTHAKTQRASSIYERELRTASEELRRLESIPRLKARYDGMDEFIEQDYKVAALRLAHNLGNLTSSKAVRRSISNLEKSPNCILYLLRKIGDENQEGRLIQIASPYLFMARYHD
jgi:hypothetical protein